MKIEYRGNEKKRFTTNIKNKIWPTIKKIYLDENKFVVGGRRGQEGADLFSKRYWLSEYGLL